MTEQASRRPSPVTETFETLDPELLGDGPSKGLRETTLLSRDARLAGRPKLCSDCGLSDSYLKPEMAQTCVFVRNQSEAIERRIVPGHVYRALAPYADDYDGAFGRALAPDRAQHALDTRPGPPPTEPE